ncbi:PilZ domain-containing protein [Desulfurobacterium pacificum]|uniref:PilZ domain-containing protein n=1 Tax=Desulfurobacterium pacificum TaxID=240166 RepID=A0ABY1NV98_9BACT|nr:PilZ domain-containing protein [Desulfurobacterium pacificum]SMP18634.1 PilZ domain-containing protein [Desulfurobacterium pacificum]
MTEYQERIINWLRELKEKEKPTEVISFYNGLPIRTRVNVLDVDDSGKFVHWNFTPKLQLAVEETGKIFTPFFDKLYKTSRMLESPVIYYSKDFMETTLPKPTADGRFNREYLRISVSDTLPLKAKLIVNNKTVEATPIDISEGGIGLLIPEKDLESGEKVHLIVEFPSCRTAETEGEVVRVENTSKGRRTGIKFINPSKAFQNEVNRYIMARQREIMNQIRMLAE